MHLSLANYIKNNKTAITLSGTRRFTDKTGEYYLKNVLIEKQTDQKFSKQLSLTNPTSITECMEKCNGINPLKKGADKIITKLPEFALTPIPMVEKEKIRNKHDNKERANAERTAVHIRRMEYSSEIHRIKKQEAYDFIKTKKIILIQQWWKILYKILYIQKVYRGYLIKKDIRTCLMNLRLLRRHFNGLERMFVCYKIKSFLYQIKHLDKNILLKKWIIKFCRKKLQNVMRIILYKWKNICFQMMLNGIGVKELDIIEKIMKKKILYYNFFKFISKILYGEIIKPSHKTKVTFKKKTKKYHMYFMFWLELINKRKILNGINKQNTKKNDIINNDKELNKADENGNSNLANLDLDIGPVVKEIERKLNDTFSSQRNKNNENDDSLTYNPTSFLLKLNKHKKQIPNENKIITEHSPKNKLSLNKGYIQKKYKNENSFNISGNNIFSSLTEPSKSQKQRDNKRINKKLKPCNLTYIIYSSDNNISDNDIINKKRNFHTSGNHSKETYKKSKAREKHKDNSKNKVNNKQIKKRNKLQPNMHFYSKKEYLKKTPDQDNQITNIRPIKPIQNKTHSIYKYEINFSESNNPPKNSHSKNQKYKSKSLDKVLSISDSIDSNKNSKPQIKLKEQDKRKLISSLKKISRIARESKMRSRSCANSANPIKDSNYFESYSCVKLRFYFRKWKEIVKLGYIIKLITKKKLLHQFELAPFFDKWKQNVFESQHKWSRLSHFKILTQTLKIQKRINIKKFTITRLRKKSSHIIHNHKSKAYFVFWKTTTNLKNILLCLKTNMSKWNNIFIFKRLIKRSFLKNIFYNIKNISQNQVNSIRTISSQHFTLSKDSIEISSNEKTKIAKVIHLIEHYIKLFVFNKICNRNNNNNGHESICRYSFQTEISFEPNNNNNQNQFFNERIRYSSDSFSIPKRAYSKQIISKNNFKPNNERCHHTSLSIDNIDKIYSKHTSFSQPITKTNLFKSSSCLLSQCKIPFNEMKQSLDNYNHETNTSVYIKRKISTSQTPRNTNTENTNKHIVYTKSLLKNPINKQFNNCSSSEQIDDLNKKENANETESLDESMHSTKSNTGIVLIPNTKENYNLINYKSQTFFLDDPYDNKIEISNKQPIQLKGDFYHMLNMDTKLFRKNHRLQVTKATCDADLIKEDDYEDEEDNNVYKNQEQKIMDKLVKLCDKDLNTKSKYLYLERNIKNKTSSYCSKENINDNKHKNKRKKKLNYSIAIPLKHNKMKWEFGNSITGETSNKENDGNKVELIQKGFIIKDKNKMSSNNISTKTNDNNRRTSKPIIKDTYFHLKEMNSSQFYHTTNNSSSKTRNQRYNKTNNQIQNHLIISTLNKSPSPIKSSSSFVYNKHARNKNNNSSIRAMYFKQIKSSSKNNNTDSQCNSFYINNSVPLNNCSTIYNTNSKQNNFSMNTSLNHQTVGDDDIKNSLLFMSPKYNNNIEHDGYYSVRSLSQKVQYRGLLQKQRKQITYLLNRFNCLQLIKMCAINFRRIILILSMVNKTMKFKKKNTKSYYRNVLFLWRISKFQNKQIRYQYKPIKQNDKNQFHEKIITFKKNPKK